MIRASLVRRQSNTRKSVPTTSHTVMLLGSGGTVHGNRGLWGRLGRIQLGSEDRSWTFKKYYEYLSLVYIYIAIFCSRKVIPIHNLISIFSIFVFSLSLKHIDVISFFMLFLEVFVTCTKLKGPNSLLCRELYKSRRKREKLTGKMCKAHKKWTGILQKSFFFFFEEN